MLSSLKSLFFEDKTSNRYLYVPFTKEELSEEVLEDINTFRSNSLYNKKDFTIIYHGEDKNNLSKLPKNAKVYVMGHGIDISPDKKFSSVLSDPKVPYKTLKHLPFSEWAYSLSGGKKAISIDTIANRMISDGLLDSDHINIKLWFCDPNCKAHAIAKKFLENFKNCKNTFKIDYYLDRTLYSPAIKDGEFHKWARNKETGDVARASSIRQSLFVGEPVKKDLVTESSSIALEERTPKQGYGI